MTVLVIVFLDQQNLLRFILLTYYNCMQYNAISLISMHREAPYLQYSFDILCDNYGIYIANDS